MVSNGLKWLIDLEPLIIVVILSFVRNLSEFLFVLLVCTQKQNCSDMDMY